MTRVNVAILVVVLAAVLAAVIAVLVTVGAGSSSTPPDDRGARGPSLTQTNSRPPAEVLDVGTGADASRPRDVPRAPQRELDSDRAWLETQSTTVQTCADADPNSPRGPLRAEVRIGADGIVTQARVTDPRFRGLDVAVCVEQALTGAKFAAGSDDRRATYDFRVR